MINETYRKKLDENGNPALDETGDFVMELVSSEEMPPEILPPNWLGLEQGLRYSALFQKAFSESSDKGLNLFMITLVNGKSGQASENALAFAFQMLGVTWTEGEIIELNHHLDANHFLLRLL